MLHFLWGSWRPGYVLKQFHYQDTKYCSQEGDNPRDDFCTHIYQATFVTARQRSCDKVMFSVVSVILFRAPALNPPPPRYRVPASPSRHIQTVEKRAVGIRLKSLLVHSEFCDSVLYRIDGNCNTNLTINKCRERGLRLMSTHLKTRVITVPISHWTWIVLFLLWRAKC